MVFWISPSGQADSAPALCRISVCPAPGISFPKAGGRLLHNLLNRKSLFPFCTNNEKKEPKKVEFFSALFSNLFARLIKFVILYHKSIFFLFYMFILPKSHFGHPIFSLFAFFYFPRYTKVTISI